METRTRLLNVTKPKCMFLLSLALAVALLSSTTMGQHYAYVTNQGEFGDNMKDDLSVVDLATNTVIATVPVGDYPQGVVINPAGTAAYVANTADNSFTVIDIPTFTSTTIPGPGGIGASGAAMHPDGTRIYITNPDWMTGGENSTIWVIDRTTNAIVDEVACGKGSCGIAVHPDGKTAYVANTFDGTIAVFDTETHAVIDTIILKTVDPNEASMPIPLIVHPEGTFVYAANRQGPTFWAVNTATHEVLSRPFGHTHVCIGISPDGAAVYLSDFSDQNPDLPPQGTTVDVIDTATLGLITTIDGMHAPLGVSVHPDGTRVYVVNAGSNSVSVIDAVTYAPLADITVGTNPEAYGQFIGPGIPRPLKTDAVARLAKVKETIEGDADAVGSPQLAIEYLETALGSGRLCLQEDLWSAKGPGEMDPRRLDASQGDTVFESARTMVQAALDAVRRGWIMNTGLREELLAVVDEVVRADRVLAAVAIDDAIVAGADPEGIKRAQQMLEQGNASVKEAAIWPAIEKKASMLQSAISQYQNAWKAALDLVQ